MMDLANALVIVHPFLAVVPDEEMEQALAPATWTASTRVFRFGGTRVSLADLVDADWQVLVDELGREDADLQRHLAATDGPAIYFGMAPIALSLELGRRLGPTRQVRPHQQRHATKSWRWPGDALTVAPELIGAPTATSLARGDVVIRVASSHPVSLEDVHAVVPHPIAELSVEVERPHEDVLQSEHDVIAFATKFGDALDAVARYLPNCETIHVFAAVPPALALRMGTEINPTIHGTPIQTYQYANSRTPRYSRAFVLGQRARLPLTPEQRAIASTARDTFRTALTALGSATVVTATPEAWLQDLLGPASVHLPQALHRLGPLGRNRTLVDATVSSSGDARGEFLWDPETRSWILDDALLAAMGERLRSDDLEIAGRLFFLHEAIHVAKQGLTSANAARVGRLPRVLEEVDYLADVWALVNDYARVVRAAEVDATNAPSFFRERVRIMTSTFWAFDVNERPLRTIPIRRFNRYLIWYWIRIALEAVSELADVMRVLGTKPIVEVAGPRIRVVDSRVVFELEPATYGDVELGLLYDGHRVVRVGTRAGAEVRALLDAVRNVDESSFLGVMRGVFDSVATGDLYGSDSTNQRLK